MHENIYKGKLIAIDGPNGVGKSTIISKLQELLEIKGYSTYLTKEPTDSILGNFIRNYSECHKGIGLACLVAADRYEHLNSCIIPQLKDGKIVITDRYILSSLILQRMDKVESDFILDINNHIIKPDLQIAVFADEEIIQKRLLERSLLTRFEKDNQTGNELKYMKSGIPLLEEKGVQVTCIINNDNLMSNVQNIAQKIYSL